MANNPVTYEFADVRSDDDAAGIHQPRCLTASSDTATYRGSTWGLCYTEPTRFAARVNRDIARRSKNVDVASLHHLHQWVAAPKNMFEESSSHPFRQIVNKSALLSSNLH